MDNNVLDFTGKVALVTGASSGMGLATAPEEIATAALWLCSSGASCVVATR